MELIVTAVYAASLVLIFGALFWAGFQITRPRTERPVSPIRASEKDRYPANWPDISENIRFDRARRRCECTGQCGHNHHGRCTAQHLRRHPVTGSRVILTVAHLDHTPENCDPANLLAMCQRCHLAYDADHHAATRARTRHAEQTADITPLFPEQVSV